MAWIPIFLLLAGCADPEPEVTTPGPEQGPCIDIPRPQTETIEVNPGMRTILNPLNSSGYMSTGRYIDFPLEGRPYNLTLVATWEPETGGQEQFRMTLYDDDESKTQNSLFVEGPSPLTLLVPEPDVDRLPTDFIRVSIRTPSTPPLGSVALVEQDVIIEVRFAYYC